MFTHPHRLVSKRKISARSRQADVWVAMRPPQALILCFVLVGAALGLTVSRTMNAHSPAPNVPGTPPAFQEAPIVEGGPSQPPITPKQRQAILKSNFEKIKRDAAELATLAKSLQQEVDKSNENVLSLKIVDQAGKIENLAKKIKNTAKEG